MGRTRRGLAVTPGAAMAARTSASSARRRILTVMHVTYTPARERSSASSGRIGRTLPDAIDQRLHLRVTRRQRGQLLRGGRRARPVATLDVQDRQGIGDGRVPGIERLRLHERPLGIGAPAELL